MWGTELGVPTLESGDEHLTVSQEMVLFFARFSCSVVLCISFCLCSTMQKEERQEMSHGGEIVNIRVLG